MKTKFVKEDMVLHIYEEDGPLNERGERWPKKGDRYYTGLPGYSEFTTEFAHFISDVQLLEPPRKASEETIKDWKECRDFVRYCWDFIGDGQWIKKVVNKAKSKKTLIYPALLEGFKQTESFIKLREKAEELLRHESSGLTYEVRTEQESALQDAPQDCETSKPFSQT